ncbi:hypothetical protein HYV89_02075 [Candidatus Woesearchaeota archaeon]|nr:hypothetical protein [Candidatus Woesearchaeota archaeon]
MKKINETYLPLLKRKEIVFEIDHARKSTPKKEEIKKLIAEELKADENLINLQKVINHFGSTRTKVIAEVYESKEDFEKLIKKNKKAKKDGKEESKEQKA